MASTLGITFGGMAKARESELDRDLRERALGLQENVFKAGQQRDLRTDAMSAIDNVIKTFAPIMQQGGAAANDMWEIGRRNVEETAVAAGLDPEFYIQQYDAAMAGQQTPEEVAQGEVRAQVAGANTLAEETGQTPETAQRVQGLRPDTARTIDDTEKTALGFPSDAVVQEMSDGSYEVLQGGVANKYQFQKIREPGTGNEITQLWHMNATGGPQVVNQTAPAPTVTFQVPETPFDTQDKEVVKLREGQISGQQFVETARSLQNEIKGRPELLKTPAWLSRTAASLASQVDGLAKISGIKGDPGIKDEATYSSWIAENFPEISGTSEDAVKVRSSLLGLAYAAAMASGQEGRAVSDFDVKRFMQRIGSDIGNPEGVAAALDVVIEETIRNQGIRSKIIAGDRAGDYGLTDPAAAGGAPATGEGLNIPADIQKILDKY